VSLDVGAKADHPLPTRYADDAMLRTSGDEEPDRVRSHVDDGDIHLPGILAWSPAVKWGRLGEEVVNAGLDDVGFASPVPWNTREARGQSYGPRRRERRRRAERISTACPERG
jgi:hypothetical protein